MESRRHVDGLDKLIIEIIFAWLSECVGAVLAPNAAMLSQVIM